MIWIDTSQRKRMNGPQAHGHARRVRSPGRCEWKPQCGAARALEGLKGPTGRWRGRGRGAGGERWRRTTGNCSGASDKGKHALTLRPRYPQTETLFSKREWTWCARPCAEDATAGANGHALGLHASGIWGDESAPRPRSPWRGGGGNAWEGASGTFRGDRKTAHLDCAAGYTSV